MTSYASTFRNSVFFSIFAAVFIAASAYGQEAKREPSQPSGPSAGASNQAETASMMAERKKMMAEMQASEKKLDELVAKMNINRGADKTDQIAAVVNELVAGHKRMSRMMSMSGGMMQRMQMGPQPNEGAATPPSSDKPEVDHQQHH